MTNKDSKQIMAENIKMYMERKGVTNQQICDDLGFKYTTFLDWTKGVTYPRIGKVEAMADYFGILKSDLIEEKTPEREEIQKKADTISDAVLRMKTDSEFLSLIDDLKDLDSEQIKWVKQMLSVFNK